LSRAVRAEQEPFGAAVRAMSHARLVPVRLETPLEEEPETLATDRSAHLVCGLGVAAAFDALDGGQ
jgi:hypothetical protein